jgi:pyruvate formate lyase activating enzyme
MPPKDAVGICLQRKVPTIAYTYSEPVIFYEYMYDIAKLGHEKSVKSVMITNGYIEEKPLADLLQHLDAVKVDLKSMREDFYKKTVDGELKPVLDRLIQIKKAGVWLEIVFLVVPTLNDSDDEFKELAGWIKEYLGVDTPLHFSRFHPQYLLKNLPMTPESTLQKAHDITRAEGLEYVYLGNLTGHRAESTYCPGCGEILIARKGYNIYQYNLEGNLCRKCGREIPGMF